MRFFISRLFCTSLMVLVVAGTLLSQPPVGPDSQPEPISMEQLSKAVGGPSLVSFSLQNVTALQTFELLAQQGGVALDRYDTVTLLKTLPTQTITFKQVPFLVALKSLASSLGLYFEFIRMDSMNNSPSGLTLRPAWFVRDSASVVGARVLLLRGDRLFLERVRGARDLARRLGGE